MQGDDGFAELVGAVEAAAVTLVIGESDTGKTTLVTALANALWERGRRVGVVDADVGQSEIGPPATIGLGRVERRLTRLADARLLALHFVGTTSPARDLRSVAEGAGRLARAARVEGIEVVVVDTAGLVRGAPGRALVRLTIGQVRPDIVICVEREGECGEALAALPAPAPAVLRLPTRNPGVRRTAAVRRRHRVQTLGDHLTGARRVTLDLARVALHGPGRAHPCPTLATGVPPDLAGTVVGLSGPDRRILGLGVVADLDLVAGTLTVETAVDAERITAAHLGRERVERRLA